MSYVKITSGNNPPEDINVIIEIPAQSAPIKYEVDKDFDALMVDRFMPAPMFYPANYGYINQTLADDGDPLDVLVVTPNPVVPASVIRSRPIGMLEMSDESGKDTKIIAVPHQKLTVLYDEVHEYTDLPNLLLAQIKNFFERYKDLEPNKWVKVDQWLGSYAAKQAITEAVAAYK